VPNKATVEAKEVCAQLVDDPEYRDRLRRRLVLGKLAPAVECMLWHYAKGKPKETIDATVAVSASIDVKTLTSDTIERILRDIQGDESGDDA
jgi:hypothetical protein